MSPISTKSTSPGPNDLDSANQTPPQNHGEHHPTTHNQGNFYPWQVTNLTRDTPQHTFTESYNQLMQAQRDSSPPQSLQPNFSVLENPLQFISMEIAYNTESNRIEQVIKYYIPKDQINRSIENHFRASLPNPPNSPSSQFIRSLGQPTHQRTPVREGG